MLSHEENSYVGLFIDWDNLAISTAVDFAGAVPDVRAIVKAAQRFGTVLVARAYAEWNVSSERLSVYRAGIEPVYAPTFRFESETGGSGSRGKSLADPCLVTDCIDTLHLMPEINVFVLVSGDKDLIPIVRLAQLRGKRVAVIGPDFSAAILRDMADEYIPYRQLAESSDNPPTEVSVHGARSHRRSAPSSRATPAPAAPAARPQAAVRPAPVVPAPTPAIPEPNGAGHEETATLETVLQPAPAEELLDTGPLFTTIGNILRERELTGKPRLRATNLKDQLIARISGFNERKYGFARFKDLLAAAEKAGVLTVSRTGPVQWVTGVGQATAATSNGFEAPVTNGEVVVPGVEAVDAPAPETETVDAEVVRFILGLRERSRWLTYTYMLTNLLNHLGEGSANAASDAEARVTLNRLVQAGVLVVDREPREIDVNGTRHRVRLCHVVDEHPLVQQVAAEMSVPPEAMPLPAPVEAAPPVAAPATTSASEEEASDSTSDHVVEVVDLATQVAPAPVADESNGKTTSPDTPSELESPVKTASLGTATAEVESTAGLPANPVTEEPVATSTGEVEPASSAVEVPTDTNGSHGEEPVAESELSLEDSFVILRDVVREATDTNRPTTGPAAIKNRLVRRLGAFDEHSFGFGKFKDYLLSAERAGAIRLEVSGNTTRVALPAETEPVAEA